MRDYLLEGQRHALTLDNRGTIQFESDGSLAQSILDAYSQYGFYIFENVIGEQELVDIQQDMDALRDQFSVEPGATLTKTGQPPLGVGHNA